MFNIVFIAYNFYTGIDSFDVAFIWIALISAVKRM